MAESVVCGILSHREIYDWDYYDGLGNTVKDLVEKNEHVEFLVASTHLSDFLLFTQVAVWGYLEEYPDNVAITFVVPYGKKCPGYSNIGYRAIHLGKSKSGIESHKDLMEWIVKRSTHLISYVYEDLYDEDVQIPESAYSHLEEIIDISSDETRKVILEDAPRMTAAEKYVYARTKEGYTKEAIGETMNMSPEKIGKLRRRVCMKYQKKLRERFSRIINEAYNRRILFKTSSGKSIDVTDFVTIF